MQFDFEKCSAGDRYALLFGSMVPRPIALVTRVASLDAQKLPQSICLVHSTRGYVRPMPWHNPGPVRHPPGFIEP